MEKQVKHWVVGISLIVSISSQTGCSYYTDQTRQANLAVNLAKYRRTMQLPTTSTTPQYYVVCDDTQYPCSLVTPIHESEFSEHDSLATTLNNQTQNSIRYQASNTQPHHRYPTRTSPCQS